MLCQNCGKNEAEFHYRQNINGEETEKHLCRECVNESGNAGQTPTQYLNSMLSNFFEAPSVRQLNKGETCPVCGINRAEISRTGKAGCPDCYGIFEDMFMPYIKRIHRATAHTGKIPESAGAEIRLKREILKKKEELRAAIDLEEFEKAATLRDIIKSLEKEGGDDGKMV